MNNYQLTSTLVLVLQACAIALPAGIRTSDSWRSRHHSSSESLQSSELSSSSLSSSPTSLSFLSSTVRPSISEAESAKPGAARMKGRRSRKLKKSRRQRVKDGSDSRPTHGTALNFESLQGNEHSVTPGHDVNSLLPVSNGRQNKSRSKFRSLLRRQRNRRAPNKRRRQRRRCRKGKRKNTKHRARRLKCKSRSKDRKGKTAEKSRHRRHKHPKRVSQDEETVAGKAVHDADKKKKAAERAGSEGHSEKTAEPVASTVAPRTLSRAAAPVPVKRLKDMFRASVWLSPARPEEGGEKNEKKEEIILVQLMRKHGTMLLKRPGHDKK